MTDVLHRTQMKLYDSLSDGISIFATSLLQTVKPTYSVLTELTGLLFASTMPVEGEMSFLN